MISYDIDDEILFFDDKVIVDSFLKEFGSTLKQRYEFIEKILCPGEVECFAIYNKDILSDEFILNFKAGMQEKWSPISEVWFDPVAYMGYDQSIPTEKNMKDIQDMLVFISKNYGKRGLELARQFYLAQSVSTVSCLSVYDQDDEYDLLLDCGDKKAKLLYFEDAEELKLNLIVDVFGSEFLVNYKNENIKSALIFVPYLLYDDNNQFLNDESIFRLLQDISERLSGYDLDVKLNFDDFSKSCSVCEQIYLERNLYKYLKSGKSKILKK